MTETTIHETDAPAPMFQEANETLVFIDIETFGLDVETDPPIEIGLVVTNLDLNVFHVRKWVIWEDYYNLRYKELCDAAEVDGSDAEFVLKMHTDSALWHEAMEDGTPRMDVEEEILDWFNEINLPKGCNLVGSSVHFDYYNAYFNLTLVQKYFHHRILDISSFKVLFEKYAPEIAKGVANLKPKKLHRVLPDIEDTMAEWDFYLSKLSIDGKKIWED